MQQKIEQNFFLFEIIASELGPLNSLYFSSAANVLTSSPKILHVNNRDFFLLN